MQPEAQQEEGSRLKQGFYVDSQKDAAFFLVCQICGLGKSVDVTSVCVLNAAFVNL